MDIDGIRIQDNQILSINSNQVVVEGASSGSGGAGINTVYIHTQNTPAINWNINHNLDSENVIVSTFDASGFVFIPDDLIINDSDNVTVVNAFARSGSAIVISDQESGAAFVFSQISGSATWNVNHNLNTENIVTSIYDSSGNLFYPLNLDIIDTNNILISYSSPQTGKVVVLTALNSGNIEASNSPSETSDITITLIAGEDIQSGDPVGIDDGKVFKFHEQRHRLMNAGTLASISFQNLSNVYGAFPCKHSENQFLLGYKNPSNTEYHINVITRSGNVLTSGTLAALPFGLETTGSYLHRTIHYGGNQYVVTVGNNIGVNNTGINANAMAMISVSGTTVNLVGSISPTDRMTQYGARLSTDQFAMLGNASTGQMQTYTANWDQNLQTWSFGTATNLPSGFDVNAKLYNTIRVNSGEYIIHMRDDVSGVVHRLARCVVSGTSVTVTSGAVLPAIQDYEFPSTFQFRGAPTAIRDGENIYLFFHYIQTTSGELPSSRVSAYRKLNTTNLTIGSEYYSGDVYAGTAGDPESGMSYFVNNRDAGNRNFLYDVNNDYEAGVISPTHTSSQDTYENSTSTPKYAAYLIYPTAKTQSISIVHPMQTYTGTYSPRAGVVFGTNRKYFAALHNEGSVLKYHLYEIYRPERFVGVAMHSAINSGEVTVLRQGKLPVVTDASNKGKYLQLFNGNIINSNIQYKAIGIHDGDSLLINPLVYGGTNSVDIYTFSLLPSASMNLSVLGATTVYPLGLGYYRVRQYSSTGQSVTQPNIIIFVYDDGSGTFRSFSWRNKVDFDFLIPGGRYMFYIAGHDSGNFLKFDLVR